MTKKFTLFIVFLLCSFGIAMAQDITIKGEVRDQKGLPLPGVSVKVKGTSQGAMTGANGSFLLKAPADGTLTFSFIGYKTAEQAIAGKTTLNVTLADDNNQLNEVVVVGYGTQTKKDLTSAIVSVSSKDIENQPITNAVQAIQGKAAGVQVSSQSGKPGAGITVSIRGNTSILASNSPLYVIDGVTSRDASFINPNDIESMTILKDASAAAIYGSSGANGVVLITTKKGTQKLAVGFNAFTGFSNLWKKEKVLNRDQYVALMEELGYGVEGLGKENTDWQKKTFGTGIQNNYQLSLSGGIKGGQYSFSSGYQQDKGVVAPAKLDKYTMHFNGSQSLTNWLKLYATAALTSKNSIDVTDNAGAAKGGTIIAALATPPTIGVYNADGTYASNPYKAGSENPYGAAFAANNNTNELRFLGSFAAEIKFTKDLSFKSSISANNRDAYYTYFLDPYMTTYGRDQKGLYNNNKTKDHVWLNENILSYAKNVDKNAFTATAGMTLQSSDYLYTPYSESNFLGPNKQLLPRGSNVPAQVVTAAQWTKRSYLARVTYAYDSKYLFTSNFRADGSSRFGKDNKYGYFPSASVGWRISGENFLKDSKSINDLKLRASWGKVGNDEGIGDYPYLELYQPDAQGNYTLSQLPNNQLQWEASTQTNLGLDLSMFNSRITFTADAYLKKTNNLLINQPLPNSVGFGKIVKNVGAVENKGLEFVLSTKNVEGKKFTWNTDLNFSLNRNKVTSLGDKVSSISFGGIYQRDDAIRVEVGRPLGSFYGYVATGVNPETGMETYKDLDGDNQITAADRTFIGSAQPKFTYGVNNTLTYGNFGLTFLFQGVQGNDIYNASRMELESLNDSKNQLATVLNRWTPQNKNTDIPKAIKDDTDNTKTSSRFVENGSYLRLKTATLSYNFGQMALGKLKMSKVMIYASSYNLLTFTKYKGFDPEVNQYDANGPSMGVDYGTYPQSRTFLFGVNVGF
ncbi:TonB-dependent receptor [Pedobacter sp.]|jgi:TonB-linked SusC/RagA family outer membrane protein|uniref:SusC/RagA family TonB-linked outer membrane protein n=1 Tax=Pedobacter sp. TaxID=1411316 RepID=UPI002CAE0468|nr:TonB-dependent receptor [Pedobacter sp.]HWW38962.1 TonB-dependent receptor [Pedobacter sp.]